MKAVQHGTTDVSTVVRFLDSTTFLPLTGLTHASSGLTLGYRRTGGSLTSITPASLAAPNSAHSDEGFKELSDGWYRLDLPDVACESGADEVLIYGTVTGGVMLSAPIALVAYNPQAVAVGAYTGTPPTIEEIAGEVWSSATRSLTDKADFALSSAAISAIEAALVNEGDSTALLQAIADKIASDLTAGDLTALAIVSAIKADETLAQMIARIDATVSSRLATGSYTAPLDSTQTQAACAAAINAYDPPTKTEQDAAFTEIKGAGWSASTDTLEKIRDASGGGSNVTITPLSASDIQRVIGTKIQLFRGETITHTLSSLTDALGNNLDLTGKTLVVVIDKIKGSSHPDFETVNATVLTANSVSFDNTILSSNEVGSFRWSLREPSNGNYVWARGTWDVLDTATED